MKPEPLRLPELLSARDAAGAPVDLFLNAWPEVEDAVLADTAHAREALTAFADALPPIAGAVADRLALACAVLTVAGDVCFADPAYLALFPDSGDLRPLLRRALREGPVVSLSEGTRGAAFTAWIGAAADSSHWPLDPEAAEALHAGPERLAVIVSAPSRSSELARRAARALDLTALEARLAEALMFAPNLEVAAAEAGVGRETARDALRRLNAKAGVRRTPELIARLISIMCAAGDPADSDEVLAAQAFSLTPAESRVAARVARGATAPEAADALGLSSQTVKSHVKAVLQKTGAHGVKDLARLLTEARALVNVATASEAVEGEEEGGGRLRIIPGLNPVRRVALIDYGPYDGHPVLIFHGAAAGRRLPAPFLSALAAAGLRPIVVQRPGFGLTDPADGDYLAAAADDLVAVIERLRLKAPSMLARDTGAASAFAFLRAYPGRLGRVAFLNPYPPISLGDERRSFSAAVQKHFLCNPDLVAAFAEFLRRQATTRHLERIFEKAFGDVASDRAALADPAVRRFLVRDIQAMCARSARGFAAEQAVYANGWEPPSGLPEGSWRVAASTGLTGRRPELWLNSPGVRHMRLDGAGVLPQFTHPEDLVRLIVDEPLGRPQSGEGAPPASA